MDDPIMNADDVGAGEAGVFITNEPEHNFEDVIRFG